MKKKLFLRHNLKWKKMAKKGTEQVDNLQELESALTKTEQFIEDNQKIITYAVGGIILIVAAYLGFNRFYLHPKEVEANSQMFMAENYFEKDSFNLAINGDGNYLGFLDIVDEYGMTKAANRASYYLGVSYLHLGQFEEALDYLNDFKTDDILLAPVTEGAKGDAYLELGEANTALKHYRKAYNMSDNELTAPVYMMKAAKVLETQDELEKAVALYEQIKEKYPTSPEATNVDRYIARAKLKLN